MAGVYGGAVFDRENIPSPYQVYRDQQSIGMQEKRMKAQEKRDQNARDFKTSTAIKSTFDPNHLTTGTPADPVINERLKGLMEKYGKMYTESQGSLDISDLTLAMNKDLMDVKAYYDNVNVVKANAMKSAEAVAKQYPGFNKQELYQKALDRGLYKEGRVIQNIDQFDLQTDFVNDVIDNDYGSLNIGNKGLYTDLQKLPVNAVDKEIVTRDKNGFESRHRGRATYNDRFQDISFDEATGEPKISLKTIPVTTPDGSNYKDKLTGKEIKTVDEDTYQELIANRQLGARINQVADAKLTELQAKNIPVDDADVQILRREAATEQLDGVFKNRTSFLSSEKNRVPTGRYKVGKADDLLPFNLDAMEADKDGNRNLTRQLGGFTVLDESVRGGKSSDAQLWLTPRGGLILRTRTHDQYGNPTGYNPDIVMYGQKARNFVEDHAGFTGNSKKDMFKMLNQFNGEGEAPAVPGNDIFPDPYKGVKKQESKTTKQTPQQKTNNSSKRKGILD